MEKIRNRGMRKVESIHDEVIMIPWQESWEQIFEEEKKTIESALSDIPATIYHIGSTSVKHMSSKPIIDILVCPKDESQIEKAAEKLVSIGYGNIGECGREGRLFLTKGNEPNETFYLHLCSEDNPVAKDQLMFQRLEREDSTIFCNYLMLKNFLAEMLPDDRTTYRLVKGLYIESVLSAYRMGNSDPASEGDDENIKYWIYEFSMTDEARSEFDAICDRYELTYDEFMEAAIEDAIRRAAEDPEAYKKSLEQFCEDTKDDHRIELVRYYPVYKGETEAQAYRRKLEEEAAEMKAQYMQGGSVTT